MYVFYFPHLWWTTERDNIWSRVTRQKIFCGSNKKKKVENDHVKKAYLHNEKYNRATGAEYKELERSNNKMTSYRRYTRIHVNPVHARIYVLHVNIVVCTYIVIVGRSVSTDGASGTVTCFLFFIVLVFSVSKIFLHVSAAQSG